MNEVKEEKIKCNMTENKTKQTKTKKKKRKGEIIKNKHTNSDEEQGELCLSCWCLPPDMFLDLFWFSLSSRS